MEAQALNLAPTITIPFSISMGVLIRPARIREW